MSILNNDQNTLILFYNSGSKNHREILAYTESASTKSHTVDISKTKVTGTVWAELADLLDVPVTELINTSHAVVENKYGKDSHFSKDDTIKMLQNDADVLVFPILVKGKKAKFIKTYNEVLEFHSNDSIGIEKTPIGKENKY